MVIHPSTIPRKGGLASNPFHYLSTLPKGGWCKGWWKLNANGKISFVVASLSYITKVFVSTSNFLRQFIPIVFQHLTCSILSYKELVINS